MSRNKREGLYAGKLPKQSGYKHCRVPWMHSLKAISAKGTFK